jgi:acetyl-CoA carboxylase biotin carboxyl carrier protein
MNADETQQLAQLLEKMPGLKSIELKDVKRLAELLRESPEIGSIEVKGFFGTGIVITRTAQGALAPMPMSWAPPPAVPAPAPPASAGSAAAPAPAAHLKEIKSPMVGTFYGAPEPGAESYAKVGTRVSPGQTVCIIEAMKIMNEIEAEIAGVVTEVCVDDAQPVEFGQALFRIDPHA